MRNLATLFKVKNVTIQVTFFVILIGFLPAYGQTMIILEQDWEAGIGSWFASNGVWEVGVPTVGPTMAHSGQNCAGTILGGNYPSGSNSRLESPLSPPIQLPSLDPGESILLKFWHWYRNSDDNGRVEISVNGGAFEQISDPLFDGTSNVWTQYVTDLSAYADSTIRIGFRFSSGTYNNDNGWYIDDIVIEKKVVPFNNPEDFELGVGDWCADNGLWEVGIDTVGPPGAHSGQNVAGIFLNHNYPSGANTRLISPGITLPTIVSDEKILLKFWQWYRISDDNGRVQISVNGGNWQTISDPVFDGTNHVWTQYVADLSAYADSTIRIGFRFASGTYNNGNGWYIDDVSIVKKVVPFYNPEDFELGVGDWSADNGLWQVGIATAGPPSAHSGQNVAGVVLGGNYPSGANTRLISPKITLNPLPGQFPVLFFWHWFRLSDDQGRVQISVNEGPWQTVGGSYTGTSPVWTQASPVDLSAYVDSTLQIGFYFTSGTYNSDNGWYIDDIRIDGITSIDEDEMPIPRQFKLLQNFPNPFNPSTTIGYELSQTTQIELNIYNISGQKIRTIVAGKHPAGTYQVQWDGKNAIGQEVSSGVYLYRLKTASLVLSRKMLLLR